MDGKGLISLFHGRSVLRICVLFLAFSLVWAGLAGIDTASWVIGGPAVVLAVLANLILTPATPQPFSFSGALGFVPYFARQSLLSGIDVMRRTFSPRQLINPGLIHYTTSLPPGRPRVFFANTISLLPGTLSADLKGDSILIHTLDTELPVWASIQQLEAKVGLLFRKGNRSPGGRQSAGTACQ